MNLLSPSELTKDIGTRAHDLRLQRGLRQVDLAQRAGVPLSTLKRFERTGQGSTDLLIRVAVALQAESALGQLFAERAPESLDEILARSRKPMRVRKRR
jgi:transcriptional regulator with XRE-family HTH domain